MFQLQTGNNKIMLINPENNTHYDIIDFDGMYNNYTPIAAETLFNEYINMINNYSEIQKYTYGQTTVFDIIALTSLVFKKLMSGTYNNIKALEVGSWFGCSSYFYASSLKVFSKSNKLFCMDTWEGTPDTESHNIANYENAFEHFRSVMKFGKVYDVIKPVVCDSKIGMEMIQQDYFDIIFVDASHTYDNAYRDVKNAIKKIKVGGLLIGHDCECYLKELPQYLINDANKNLEGVDGYHYGVIKALDDIFGEDYERVNVSLVWYKYITEEDKRNAMDQEKDIVFIEKAKNIIELSETLTEALDFICSNIENVENKINSTLIRDSISALNCIENIIIDIYPQVNNKDLKILTNDIKDILIELSMYIEDKNIDNAENLINTKLIDNFNNWRNEIDEEFLMRGDFIEN